MKKTLLALAALTAFAGAAQAQSSVTVFGVVDLSVRNQDNNGPAGDRWNLSSGGNATSRLGFRGVEDLGGGLKGGFWLEGEIRPDSGTGESEGSWNWRRRSTLSLIGGFGEVRLGRDYTPTYWNHSTFDPFGDVGVGAQTNLMTQVDTSAGTGSTRATTVGFNAQTLKRASNSVSYFLPAMGGVYGQIMVAAGEGNPGNKYVGGRLGYAAGPFDIAVAYGQTEDAGFNDDLTAANIGASWDFGVAKLMLQYHQYDAGSLDQQNALIGAAVPFGAMTFKVSYGMARVDLAGGGDADAQQLALGVVYDLSKRTALYATASVIDNDNGLGFVTSNDGAALPAGGGEKSTGYEIGVRHSF